VTLPSDRQCALLLLSARMFASWKDIVNLVPMFINYFYLSFVLRQIKRVCPRKFWEAA